MSKFSCGLPKIVTSALRYQQRVILIHAAINGMRLNVDIYFWLKMILLRRKHSKRAIVQNEPVLIVIRNVMQDVCKLILAANLFLLIRKIKLLTITQKSQNRARFRYKQTIFFLCFEFKFIQFIKLHPEDANCGKRP